MNILVSIIIPVYNTEKYLRQCLDSVVNQTFKDIEIIVINDCSPDNCLQIIKEYQQKDDRIVLVDLKQNGGLSNARNKGINISKGKYITFVDSDDWIRENYIEFLYENMKKYNTDFVSANLYFFNNQTGETSLHVNKLKRYNSIIHTLEDKKRVLQKTWFLPVCTVWTKIFKRDFLVSNNILFKTKKMEDILFIWEAIMKAKNFVFLKDTIYYYRVGLKNSNSASLTIENYFVFFHELNLLSKQFGKSYFCDIHTYISLECAIQLEKIPFKKSYSYFLKFKELFYNEHVHYNYNYILLRDKIRLLFFTFCLKHNLNYCFIGKIHRTFNPIRLFIRR